ncbi:uncharacterized protein LOC127717558 [Mytilus californianus]|uniref:uncharacterized protein LOC127717558 n=1 Tax=Mytilus californianus TaxID=6549 RepID=UPI002247070B|nr:uncharacterized protein LOC127717558 [Mytilus californianus]
MGFIEKLKENQCDLGINSEEHCVCDVCRFRQSNYRFVIGHPEHILNKTVFDIFKNSCWQEKVTYIIVDEAHCIEKWGNDFRTDYKKISQLRSVFPLSRVLALTGTATQKTCETIEKSLCLKKVHVVKSSIVRDNIKLLCEKRPPQNTLDSFRTVISPLISDLRKNKDKFPKTVVYSKLKWCAEGYQLTMKPEEDGTSVCEEVKTIVSQYHAPCTEKFKAEVVEQMNCGSLRLLFATEAYSMGTDAPDIRQVVHYGVPSSLETYLQEVGRAGRDGIFSTATLYYNKYDIGKNMPVDQEVRDFVMTTDCRWENLCKYFGSEFARKVDGHDCCDNCEKHCDCLLCYEPLLETDMTEELPKKSKKMKLETDNKEVLRSLLFQYFKAESEITEMPNNIPSTGLSLDLIEKICSSRERLETVQQILELFPYLKHQYAENIAVIIGHAKHSS